MSNKTKQLELITPDTYTHKCLHCKSLSFFIHSLTVLLHERKTIRPYIFIKIYHISILLCKSVTMFYFDDEEFFFTKCIH